MKRASIILFLLFIGWFYSVAQQIEIASVFTSASKPCSENYPSALDAFEIGDFENAISLLTGCTTGSPSDQEKIDRYLLLCRSYYNSRYIPEAEEQARQVYKINPEYKIDPDEKIGIQNLFQRAKPRVRHSFALLLGINLALPITTTNNNYEGDPRFKTATSHKTQPGIDVNVQWKYYTNRGIDLIVGISYSQLRFHRRSESQSSFFNTLIANAEETDQILKMELGASYTMKKEILGILPYFELGGSYNYLLSSTVEVQSAYILNSPELTNIPGLDFYDNRQNSVGIFLTAGGLRKVRRGNLMFKIQYYIGLTSQVDRSQVLLHQELIFSSNYFDNDFKLNYITISVGFERFYFKYR